jgi:hypothetical protein
MQFYIINASTTSTPLVSGTLGSYGITTATTTWLGDNFDSVLLYGALVEGYTFMKGEPDVIAFYDKKYQDALMLAKRLGDGLERQDAYRSGQARVPVT